MTNPNQTVRISPKRTAPRMTIGRLFECQCGAVVEEIDGVRYSWLSHKLHPAHLTVIKGGRQ